MHLELSPERRPPRVDPNFLSFDPRLWAPPVRKIGGKGGAPLSAASIIALSN